MAGTAVPDKYRYKYLIAIAVTMAAMLELIDTSIVNVAIPHMMGNLGATLDEVYPADHVRAYIEKTLENLALPRLDLMQLHVWEDAWADDVFLHRNLHDAKREVLIGGIGFSINRL